MQVHPLWNRIVRVKGVSLLLPSHCCSHPPNTQVLHNVLADPAVHQPATSGLRKLSKDGCSSTSLFSRPRSSRGDINGRNSPTEVIRHDQNSVHAR